MTPAAARARAVLPIPGCLPLVVLGLLLPAAVPAARGQATPPSPAPAGETITLNPFVVAGEKARGYRATNSISGTAMNTPLRDVPMTINVITGEFLDDMLVGDFTRTLDYNASVVQTSRPHVVNRTGLFAIRGFRGRNILVDGVQAGDFVPSYFIDRIEVVKGPNTLYGQTDPGGLVNVITKRPASFDFAHVEVMAGNMSYYEATADYNASSLDGRLGVRVLGAYRHSEEWKWVDGSETAFYGVAGEYRLGRDTVVSLHVSEQEKWGFSSMIPAFPFEVRPTDLNGDGVINSANVRGVVESGARYNNTFLPREFTSITTDDTFTQTNRLIQGGLRHALSQRAHLQYTFTQTKQSLQGTFREFNTFGANNSSPVTYSGIDRRDETEVHTLNGLFEFDTGGIKHRILAGVRTSEDIAKDTDNFYNLRGNNAGEVATLNSIAGGRTFRLALTKAEAVSGAALGREDSPTFAELKTFGTRSNAISRSQQEVTTYYLSDSLTLADDRVRLLAGVRQIKIKSFARNLAGAITGVVSDQKDTGFQAGAVVDVVPGVSAYGNYATAFNPNAINPATGSFYDPEESKAYELGLKLDGFWGGRLGGSVSYFNIAKDNVVRRDFNPNTSQLDTEVSDDESTGFEVELFLNLERWNTVLSYADTNARTVRSQTVASGLGLEGAAPQRFSLWTSYELGGALRGLRLGGGLVWADGPIQQFGNGTNRLIFEDGYTQVDLFARFPTKIAGRDLELGFNVSNLTDEVILLSRGATNTPRQFVFSARLGL